VPQDETGRRPDLSDLDSFAGVDELGAEGYEDSDDREAVQIRQVRPPTCIILRR